MVDYLVAEADGGMDGHGVRLFEVIGRSTAKGTFATNHVEGGTCHRSDGC